MRDMIAPDGSKNSSGFGSKNHGGRPRGANPKSERSLKPWVALGISERTYYRRRSGSQQQASHVSAWLRTLGPFQRLDYRAAVRRAVAASIKRQGEDPVLELYMRAVGAN